MNRLSQILSVTFLLVILYCIYEWYVLVYMTKVDFVENGRKLLEAMIYEALLIKIIITLIVVSFIFGLRHVFKKKDNKKNQDF